jgi:hypothetical protein
LILALVFYQAHGSRRRDDRPGVSVGRAGYGARSPRAGAVLSPAVRGLPCPDRRLLDEALSGLRAGGDLDLSALLHAVHLFGPEAVAARPGGGGTDGVVDLLLDGDRGARHFGGQPTMVRTPHGARYARYDPTLVGVDQRARETHRGQVLAVLGGLGVPPGQPVRLPGDEAGTLRMMLDDLTADFSLGGEIEWEAIALALYLPPARTWVNRRGETFSFDALCEELIRRPVESSTCSGTHRLISLVVLLRSDRETEILSPWMRAQLTDVVRSSAEHLARVQDEDGSWGRDWYKGMAGDERDGPTAGRTRDGALAVTGHHLEWLMLLPDEFRPPRRSFERAIRWLLPALKQSMAEGRRDSKWYCPATHAARSIRLLTEPGGTPG